MSLATGVTTVPAATTATNPSLHHHHHHHRQFSSTGGVVLHDGGLFDYSLPTSDLTSHTQQSNPDAIIHSQQPQSQPSQVPSQSHQSVQDPQYQVDSSLRNDELYTQSETSVDARITPQSQLQSQVSNGNNTNANGNAESSTYAQSTAQSTSQPQSPRNLNPNLRFAEDEAPWPPEIQKKYDAFLHDERIYVTEGKWDRFAPGSRLFVGEFLFPEVNCS